MLTKNKRKKNAIYQYQKWKRGTITDPMDKKKKKKIRDECAEFNEEPVQTTGLSFC